MSEEHDLEAIKQRINDDEPLHKRMERMKQQSEKCKVLLKKTKELKDEMKYDLYCVDQAVEECIEKIAEHFKPETLSIYKNTEMQELSAQLQELKI